MRLPSASLPELRVTPSGHEGDRCAARILGDDGVVLRRHDGVGGDLRAVGQEPQPLKPSALTAGRAP